MNRSRIAFGMGVSRWPSFPIVLSIASLSALLSGCCCTGNCKTPASADVKCGSLQSWGGNIGTLNTPHFALGAIAVLNKANKNGFYLSSITASDAQKATSSGPATETDQFDRGFTVTASVNVPASVTADVKTAIANASAIEVTNVKRVSLNDVASLVNADANAKKAVKSIFSASPQDKAVMVVSSVTYVDSVNIKLNSSVDATASANVLTVGDFKITVNYHCNDVVKMGGTQFGGFFKVTFVKMADDDVAVDADANIDLSEYNLQAAIM